MSDTPNHMNTFLICFKRHVRISTFLFFDCSNYEHVFNQPDTTMLYFKRPIFVCLLFEFYCFDPRSTLFRSFLKLTNANVVSDVNVNSFEPNTITTYVLSLYILIGNQTLTGRALRKLDFYHNQLYTNPLTSKYLLVFIKWPVGRLKGLQMRLGKTLRKPLKHRSVLYLVIISNRFISFWLFVYFIYHASV